MGIRQQEINVQLTENLRGGYRFLEGISPYCSGVIANSGYEIVHVTLQQQLPWKQGMLAARQYIGERNLPSFALCGFELRCSRPYSMDGFIDFNTGYCSVLKEWDMYVDGVNPVARTCVAPVVDAPRETMLFGFSYCTGSTTAWETFVVAGGGELTGSLREGDIVREGETDDAAMADKAQAVVNLMNDRLTALGADPEKLTTVDIYTAHPMAEIYRTDVIPGIPGVAGLGAQWFLSRPPIEDIEFEMDMRGVRTEHVLKL